MHDLRSTLALVSHMLSTNTSLENMSVSNVQIDSQKDFAGGES